VDVLLDYWKKEIKKDEPFYLMVIGDGPDREPLIEQAKALGLEDRVSFTGRIEHPDLPPYLASADVYITASLSEMNSISMLEGMAAGLPVLQRFDELNQNQICVGTNGYLFKTAQEMGDELRHIGRMTPEEKERIRITTRQSVKSSGAESLANYMLAIYNQVEHKK